MITALITSMILFSIGVFGVLSRRDLIRILISVSVILGSITLLIVTLTTDTNVAPSYSLVLFVWAVEAVEIIVALAIFLYLSKNGKGLEDLEHFKW